MSLDILAVGYPGNSGDIEPGHFSHILQDHRLQPGLIALNKILFLVFQDRIHGKKQGVLSLPYCINKPLCCINLLLYKLNGIFHIPALALFTVICLQHFCIGLA